MNAVGIADRLRVMRRSQHLRQSVVATALGVSVSAISRLERGVRGLRLEQVVSWAKALGYRAEVVFWEPILDDDTLDEESRMLLADVAASLPHMPGPARRALAHEVQLWREEALRANQ